MLSEICIVERHLHSWCAAFAMPLKLIPAPPRFLTRGRWHYVSNVNNGVEKLQTIGSSLGNEEQRSRVPKVLILIFLAFVFFLSSCVDAPNNVGSVLFSSNQNCLVRVFNADGKQLIRIDVPHDATVSADMWPQKVFLSFMPSVPEGWFISKRCSLRVAWLIALFFFAKSDFF